MKRWALPALVLTLVLSLPPSLHAQAKDTLTVALVSHAPTMDPHMHFERVGILVNINMFDSLLHRNTKLEFEPSIATSWKALSDTQWEFKIRKGVRFHNGEVLTPEDVKYSFDRVIDQTKKSPQYGNIRAIKEVKVVNADTVHIITDKPFPLLLERLVFFPIVPKKHIEAVGDQAFGSTSPVGTGPWKFVEWKRDQYIKLEAFDQHWRGKPALPLRVSCAPTTSAWSAGTSNASRRPAWSRWRLPTRRKQSPPGVAAGSSTAPIPLPLPARTRGRRRLSSIWR
jgi:peptide/nickel transport system substrate-binding protein